jgi:hypothetical protein
VLGAALRPRFDPARLDRRRNDLDNCTGFARPIGAGARAMTRQPNAVDFWRGFALITIFIDHIPGLFYAHYTLPNFSSTRRSMRRI